MQDKIEMVLRGVHWITSTLPESSNKCYWFDGFMLCLLEERVLAKLKFSHYSPRIVTM